MSSKSVNYFFMGMVVISVLFALLAFKTWNPSKEYDLQPDKALTHFHVDQCQFVKNRVTVSGWALVGGEKHIKTDVYLEQEDGKYTKMFTRHTSRPDVSSYFDSGNLYDLSGFKAAQRVNSMPSNTALKIKIVSKITNGDVYSASYICE
ncbi:hypothetical protein ABT56_09770 [Photobacterium aquae]|uniref:Uncharacterized protein n=1 Tax=Photobacterium aquae TaxID=1195763 RepID=A0A0J1H232_9GAMM|nr:hypothetical protein [Photobacterium aquae]KLV05821.1 hypothetical protein ABT56_09770 [Photobacterium aquae]